MVSKKQEKYFVTFTAPTCSGKSYLLNYIRDVAKLPCLLSTTTRAPRDGERNGIDYYFISEEKSREIEAHDGFAELAIFRGNRYGVTKEEFYGKLNEGIAFLICEPTGIDHYVKPALEAKAIWFKYFIDVDIEIRLKRFKKRFDSDVDIELHNLLIEYCGDDKPLKKIIHSYTDRLIHMLGSELQWKNMVKWDGILDGTNYPEHNLEIILKTIKQHI